MPNIIHQIASCRHKALRANAQREADTAGRNSQVDLLRASAIVMVVAYHLTQMSPKPLPAIMRFMTVGQYGVDLFFVLSGWLIGGLYWKERACFGKVDLLRFWARRWLRTIPPYFGALALAWVAVRWQRHESFNWGYLCFVQNYYDRLPYFLVSWSLCIEEHFYLFLPLLLVWLGRRRWLIAVVFISLILAAPVCRSWLSRDGAVPEFGFKLTATHLRLEGLLLGFSAAYLRIFAASQWRFLQRLSLWGGTASAAVLIPLLTVMREGVWMYRIGLTALAVLLVAVLIWLVEKKPGPLSSSRLTKAIALSSYSVYLIHALCLHVARSIVGTIPALPWFAYFPIALLLITSSGAAYYFAVEHTSIQLRDRLVPRRMARG